MSGDPPTVERLDEASWIGVPSIVIGELEAGFRLGTRMQRNAAELEAFLSNPVVEVLPIDRGVATVYAEILVELRRKGTPVPTNDVWVAAATARAGAPLLTFDGHFDEIDRIGVLRLGRTG